MFVSKSSTTQGILEVDDDGMILKRNNRVLKNCYFQNIFATHACVNNFLYDNLQLTERGIF